MTQTVKLIPFEKIIQIMDQACTAFGVKRSESQILDAMLTAFPAAVVQDQKYVAYDDVVLFMDNWVKALKTKDFNFLTQRRGLRFELPDPEEILMSKEYLNQATQVRPAIKKEFLNIFESGKYYPEVILTGATGVGKDYLAYLIYGVTLIHLYAYFNPQVEFGLAAGTSIVLAIQSITKELAKKVTFDELVGTVLRPSKFFTEKFSWDKTVTAELRFPGNIFVRPFSGEDTSALGMAIFSCFPAEQEYVSFDGYSDFGEGRDVRILTSDGYDTWVTQDSISVIQTGVKRELIRLWFGDTFIDCTPNQKFKDENNEWIEAERCGGVRLLSCNMPAIIPEGVTKKISAVVCTKVERLMGKYTVYDLKNVPETNTLIVPTQDKNIHLLAHNSIVNEMSFMKVVSKSKKTGGKEYDQASRIYKTLTRRIAGRFNKFGKVPGKMILISSAKEEGDFISSRLKALQDISQEERDKVYVMRMSQWDSFAGMDRLMTETFLVEVGDDTKQSKILNSMDDAIEPADVIEVPMDYFGAFEQDIDGALADIAGVFIRSGTKKFIPYKEAIINAGKIHSEMTGGIQLFLKDSIVFDRVVDTTNPDYNSVVNMDYIKQMMTPNAEFAVHIDYGFVGDATGIAISHIDSQKLVPSAKLYDPITNGYKQVDNLSMPVFFVDGVLQVFASSGIEVDIDFIEGLIHFLKEYINIKWVTFDSYESRSSIQGFRKRGMIAGVVSTVTTAEPYTELKNALKTDRILYPNSEILKKEIRELERLPNGKIDHPPSGGKDMADAVAATLHVLMRKACGNVKGRQSIHDNVSRESFSEKRERPTANRRSRFSTV